jgi:cardiolipin synthase
MLLLAGCVLDLGLAIRRPDLYTLAHLPALIMAIRITASAEKPEYKLPWLLFLSVLPITAIPAYLCFYRRTLTRCEVKMLSEIRYGVPKKEDFLTLCELSRNGAPIGQIKELLALSASHIYKCRGAEYIRSGKDFMERLLQDVECARKYIYLEFYILEIGEITKTIIDKLIEKARHGVEVRLIYDDLGSMLRIGRRELSYMREGGIKPSAFLPSRPFFLGRFNNRMHRKICIIDGRVGYIGGINLADEYFNGSWRDSAIRICGEVTNEAAYAFCADARINGGEDAPIFSRVYDYGGEGDCGYAIPFFTSPRPIADSSTAEGAIISLIENAKTNVKITTPYLIIDNNLFCAIERAIKRGVDICIIIPKKPDKRLVYTVTEENAMRLLTIGCRILRYTGGFLHAKTYIADGSVCIMGSINLDYRSLYHNFECGIWLYDCDCTKDAERDVDSIALLSEELRIEEKDAPPQKRLVRTLIRIISPLL